MKILTQTEMLKAFNEYRANDNRGKKCGLSNLDQILRMDKKNLAVLTARPNEGKSTFVNYYAYKMATENQWKTLYFNYETDNGRFINDLVMLYGNIDNVIKYSVIADVNSISNINDLYKTIETQKKENNISLCVIDPFMRLNAYIKDINTYSIGQILTNLQQIAIKNDVLLIVVAHPTKLKEGEEINPNDIMGSTYFYTVADFIFSLRIYDRERLITEIKTLKIRNNYRQGVCGRKCYFKFNPTTQIYSPIDTPNEDVLFGKDIAKQIMREMSQNKAVVEPKSVNVDKSPTQEKQIQCEPNKKPFSVDDIKVGVFKNCNTKVPQKLVTLREAVNLGKEQIETIERIRKICSEKKEGWEQEKRILKTNLMCYLPQVQSRNRRINEDTKYNNIIVFDIDEKDNNTLDFSNLKETIKKDPHTLYISDSVSGRGLYGYFIGNGNIEDYEYQFKAMQNYFKAKYNIIIDGAAKDITRLRFVSYDPNDYWNLYAEPFTQIEQTTHHQINTLNKKDNFTKEINPLNEEEKNWFFSVLEEISNYNLILSDSHEESNAIGTEIAYYFGEKGLDYYLTIRKQRKQNYNEIISTNKYYNICRWVVNNDYVRSGKMQTIRHYYYRALSEYENKLAESQNCGIFRKQ